MTTRQRLLMASLVASQITGYVAIPTLWERIYHNTTPDLWTLPFAVVWLASTAIIVISILVQTKEWVEDGE